MDLRFSPAQPSAAEKRAIDLVLGAPRSRWDGGTRGPATDGHAAQGGHEARSRRHLLLPALHAAHDRVGWISEGALNYVCRRLTVPPAEAYGVATFYGMFSLERRPANLAHVCDDVVCRVKGAEALCEQMKAALGPAGGKGRRPARAGSGARVSDCASRRLRLSSRGRGSEPRQTSLGAAHRRAHHRRPPGALTRRARCDVRRCRDCPSSASRDCACCAGSAMSIPRASTTTAPTAATSALRRAVELGPEAVVREVALSKLVGRGGAAFPTGRKWEAVAKASVRPHYLVCNADESEPGTFKDRILMEQDPFAVIEAMTIAGIRDRLRAGLCLRSRRVPAGRGTVGGRRRRGPHARPSRR